MISYTDAQMEQERNDPKWLINSGCNPKIEGSLTVDTVALYRVVENAPIMGGKASMVRWGCIHKYRLHNGPGYKDGIAIDSRVDEHKPTSTRDKLLSLLNDNEAMEVIALEACLEQQKVIDKARQTVILAAADVIQSYEGLDELYDAGMLTLPGESNAEIERLKAKVDDQQQHINGMIHGGDCK